MSSHFNSEHTTVLCTYHVKQGADAKFIELLEKHWPAMKKLGLAADVPSQIFRGDEEGGSFFVEVFTWSRPGAAEVAHQTPGVMAIWEPMGNLCEARNGKPPMEFPSVERLTMKFEQR
jgi:hypothetical protein